MPRQQGLTRRGLLIAGGRGAAGLALAGGLLGIAGCGSSSSSSSSTAGAEQITKLGFDHPNNGIPLWEDIMRWSQEAAKQQGVTLLKTADDTKLDRQVANLSAWIAQGVPAIISYPLEPATIETLAKRARKKGITWVTYAANIQNQDGSVLLNNLESGRLLGKAAADFVNREHGGRGKALHLTFPDGGEIGRQRDQGVVEAFKQHAPNAEIVASQKAVDPATGLKVTSSVLSAHRDLAVVMGMNDDGALGAYRAFLDRGHAKDDPKVFIGGQDGAKAALQLIKQGTMYRASVALSIRELGKVCVDHTLALAKGTATSKSVNVPVFTVTADDTAKLDALIAELKA